VRQKGGLPGPPAPPVCVLSVYFKVTDHGLP
jgi:hypothetical protein